MTIIIGSVYHKPADLVVKEGYVGVLAGSSISKQKSKDGYALEEKIDEFSGKVYHDSDGSQNISQLNRSLNEMTVIYWMWKNYDKLGDPDFVGLCHYRRYFIFNENLPLPSKTWLPFSHVHCFSTLGDIDDYIDTTQAVEYFNQGFNFLTTYPYDSRFCDNPGIKSCKEHFYNIYQFDDTLYDRMEQIVLLLHPDYDVEVQELRIKPMHYLFNMFVTSRDIFFSYCDFIFPILFQLLKDGQKTDDLFKMRGPGFISEFLTSMFISHGIRTGKLRVKLLPVAYLENTDIKNAPYTESFSARKSIELLFRTVTKRWSKNR